MIAEPACGKASVMDSITAIRLSKRQIECLQGVAEHLDSQQIAHRLGISPHTVDGHISSAIKALGAQSRRDAVKRLSSLSSQSLTGAFPPVDYPAEQAPNPPSPEVVQEERSIFEINTPVITTETRNDHVEQHPLRMIALITSVAAALIVILLALDPLIQSASRLANTIQPYRTSS